MTSDTFVGWSGDLSALQLRIAIVIALAWVAARLLRRRSSSVEHRVWTLAVAAIVLLPLATWLVPAFELATSSAKPDALASAPAVVPASVALEPAAALPGAIEGGDATDAALPWLAWFVGVWALGATVLVGHVLVRLIGARILVTGASAPTPALAARLARLGCDPRVTIRVADGLASPIVVGVVRPVVLLPRAAESWPSARLRPVLLHELAHVAHGDARWLVVAALARAIGWVDPFVWWAVARLRRVAELAADDAVVAAGIDPHDYARELVEHARESAGVQRPAFVAAMLGHNRLPERVAALLWRGRPRSGVPGRVAVPLALGTLGAVASLAAMHIGDESRTIVSIAADSDEAIEVVEHARVVAPEPVATILLRPGSLTLRDRDGAQVIDLALDGVTLPPEIVQGHLVTPLRDAVTGTRLRIDAEGTVPWSTLLDVLYTSGRAGVREWEFRADDRWLSVSPPTFPRDIDDRCRIEATAAATPGLAAAERSRAVRECEACGGHIQVRFTPDREVPYEAMIDSMVALVDVPDCRVDVVVAGGA